MRYKAYYQNEDCPEEEYYYTPLCILQKDEKGEPVFKDGYHQYTDLQKVNDNIYMCDNKGRCNVFFIPETYWMFNCDLAVNSAVDGTLNDNLITIFSFLGDYLESLELE